MEIKKDTPLKVIDYRSGTWTGIALEDFDTDKDEWYPVAVAQENPVKGLNTVWEKGDKMPCRRGLCKIEVISK